MDDVVDVDRLVDALIEREGGYVDHPADKGGPTCFGITEAVARAHGYAGTIANYRSAAETARAADRANAERIAAEQRAINERTQNDFESRLAAARTRAGQLRLAAQAPADPGHGRAAPVPGLPAASGRASDTAGENRLPAPDALTATEQAIQLDELIKWVRAQAKVDATSP